MRVTRGMEDLSQFRQLGLVGLIVLIVIVTGSFSPRLFSRLRASVRFCCTCLC